MADKDIALMAHLMRRAGFGATRAELEGHVAKGYDATVEELLTTDGREGIADDLLYRYLPDHQGGMGMAGAPGHLLWRVSPPARQASHRPIRHGCGSW